MLVLYGVSRGYLNGSKRVKNTRGAKKYPFAYYYDESGKISKKRISKIKYFYLKYFRKKAIKITFVCENCGNKFKAIVKNRKDKVDCPKCEV